ncbi:MAG TPA: hypothetical protein PKD85_05115 [Saprospiraceae bacterium]|nr:hypothetical protein [Saprospiraceae bacterium]
MGQGPLKCSNCTSVAKNRVYYENQDVLNRWADNGSQIKNFDVVFDTLDFASEEAKKIKDIVGSISISLGVEDPDMDQLLCDKCLDSIDFNLLKNTKWKYHKTYSEKGYFKSQLP